MFEGSAAQAWDTMLRLRELPDDTTVYCAHEYTESNASGSLRLRSAPTTATDREARLAKRAQATACARTPVVCAC